MKFKILSLLILPLVFAVTCISRVEAQYFTSQILHKNKSDCSADSSRNAPSDRYISSDKLSHFSVSSWLVGAIYYGNRVWLSRDKSSSRSTAILLSVSIGILKEMWDKKTSYFSFKDLAADLLGTAFGFAIYTLNEP